MTMIELQDKFAIELASSMTSRWDSIKIHYENMTVGGEVYELFTAFYYVGEIEHQFNLGIQALDTLIELKKHLPLGQAEKWTWFEFEFSSSGKYQFDYKYDMPPLIANELKYADKS
jgi:hypothetical protein